MFKRKYNRGRLPENRRQEWLFGGVQRGSSGRECFLVPVQRRDAATLLPLIQEHILPGTRIISDEWASYHQIQNIQGQQYQHNRINHTYNFVDPADPTIHTQNVENMWGRFKKSHMKRANGVKTELFGNYVMDFMWFRLFGGDNVMYNFWTQVLQLYPCEI